MQNINLENLKRPIHISEFLKNKKVGNIPFFLIITMLVFLLAISQDYIYSKVHSTGFYLSESSLYNTLWVLFIPFTLIINRLMQLVRISNIMIRIPLSLGIGLLFSLLHITFFAAVFVFVSNVVFNPPHRFMGIFNAALSNQFFIAVSWYTLYPIIHYAQSKMEIMKTPPLDGIRLKVDSKIIVLPTTSIQLITTDKPYTSVCTADGKRILDRKSLKEFQTKLDPVIFIRVHRSILVNKNYIQELQSRNNGDYDATLKSGRVIRLSRHYRDNWKDLIQ